MDRLARCGCVLLLLTTAGCGPRNEDYVEAFREQRAVWNEMADILDTIKDEQTMATAKADLDQRWPKFEAAANKIKALPTPPPPEVVQRLRVDIAEHQAVLERVSKRSAEVQKLPGGREFIRHFQSRSEGLSSAVQK